MLSQEIGQMLAQETLSQDEILEKRKQAIKNLLEEMTDSLPVMAQSMLMMYRSTVYLFIDKITYEQTEELLNKIQSVIDGIRGEHPHGKNEK